MLIRQLTVRSDVNKLTLAAMGAGKPAIHGLKSTARYAMLLL